MPAEFVSPQSKLVIKIIKAFFILYLYDACGILMKKSHSLARHIKSATRHSRRADGNVFVNNYQKYFLINAFLSIQLDSTRYDTLRCVGMRSLFTQFLFN